MTIDKDDLLNSILESIGRIESIKLEDIPNIDLYMDQITTFMDNQLEGCKRHPEDKILTKTMINNYAKNELLPSPDKKKYSKNHVIMLTFIYYFKNVLSISDIKTLMQRITSGHFQPGSKPGLEDIYSEVLKFQPDVIDMVRNDVREKTEMAEKSFGGASGEEAEYLKLFSLLCLLSFDVYMKKTLIEAVIDSLNQSEPEKEKKEKKGEKRERK